MFHAYLCSRWGVLEVAGNAAGLPWDSSALSDAFDGDGDAEAVGVGDACGLVTIQSIRSRFIWTAPRFGFEKLSSLVTHTALSDSYSNSTGPINPSLAGKLSTPIFCPATELFTIAVTGRPPPTTGGRRP